MKTKRKGGRKPASQEAERHVRVRMYDVGFGDGFVLFFPDGRRFRTLVLDCGSIHAGDHGPIADVAERIVADIVAETGRRRVDVVVATHRHKDHVSGFASDVWDGVDVGEVWLPWTEDPSDPEATRIRETQASLALALSAGRPGAAPLPLVAELAANALSNAQAMETLHRGFRSRKVPEPRFLPPKERADGIFRTPHLPRVVVRVLGPSRKESVIRDMEPPPGESYLAAIAASAQEDSGPRAFAPSLGIPREDFAAAGGSPLAKELEQRATVSGEVDDTELAATLDSAVNGTSLMLMLDLGKARLLLPGDAQWGTWQAALTDDRWRPLFSGMSFYKVGHHGSHNATPKDFVDGPMPDRIPAMTSVTPVKQWKRIPLKALADAMSKKRVALARSDQPEKAPSSAYRTADDGCWIETWLPI